ncbi:DUF2516 family protein [Corynebacterium sp. CCM 9204]
MDIYIFTALKAIEDISRLLMAVVGLLGIIGAALCAATREDAYTAADRQQKWVWVGLLVGSGIALFLVIPFMYWAGMVIIGIYWFDVRPELKDIVDGETTW